MLIKWVALKPTYQIYVRGGNHSLKDHILNACKFTGASADWIFGLQNEIYRSEKRTVIDRLMAIAAELERKKQ